ncbi:hypothetical protein ABLN73_02605, partial [Mycobacterium tuberculosis]
MRREEEPGNQTTPGDDARRLRREEEPGNQMTPGDDARRLRREEEPGEAAHENARKRFTMNAETHDVVGLLPSSNTRNLITGTEACYD